MNKFQKRVAQETKKRLDLDAKVEEFSKQLEEMKTVGEIETILDQIDLLPSWYEIKKGVVRDFKKSK